MIEPSEERNVEFVELTARYQRGIYGYIYMLVQNHADTEDLLQQTSLVLWRKFDQFESGSNFLAWACQIAHYEILKFRKENQRHGAFLSDELLERIASERISRSHTHDLHRESLHRCMEKLNQRDNQLIKMCYEGKQSIKQVAVQIGRPVDSVYVSLNRIRRVLLECVRRAISKEATE